MEDPSLSQILVSLFKPCGSFPIVLHQSPGLSHPPHSWAVIPPDMTISRHVELLVSIESTVLIIDNLESVDQRLSRGPFTHISPSPNGKALALLTMSGTLWVVSIDFQRSLAEYDTHNIAADELAQQVEWCGNDAILVTWESVTALIGPFGDILQYDKGFLKVMLFSACSWFLYAGITMLGMSLRSPKSTASELWAQIHVILSLKCQVRLRLRYILTS